jgi:hypothetical protein
MLIFKHATLNDNLNAIANDLFSQIISDRI